MAINRKDDFIREISMMIHREFISFEPKDRIPLNLESGKDYFVGSVYYDFDCGKLAFDMYNSKGELIPSVRGYRLLENSLSPAELMEVSDMVCRYCEESKHRARHMRMLSDLMDKYYVNDHTNIVRFQDPDYPHVYVDDDGVMCYKTAVGLQRQNDGNMYILTADKEVYPLSVLTDIGIKSIAASAPNGLYKQIVRVIVPAPKEKKTNKMSL